MFEAMDPGDMTPEQRAREAAGILAQGFLRLRKNGLFEAYSRAKPEGKEPVTRNISNGCDTKKSAS